MGMEKKSCVDLALLSEDVLINILVRLPVVKSMLRFKSVCKSWRDLIESSLFIDLHTTFNSSSSSSNFGAFILQATEPSVDSYEDDFIRMYRLSSGSGDGGCEDDDDEYDQKKMVFKMDDLGFSPFYKDYLLRDSLRMVGSCNGIICLHDPVAMDGSKGNCRQQHYSNLRDVYLWNPATRQFRILPKSIPIEERYPWNETLDFVAFGFDVKTKDYKVLRITPLKPEGRMCRVQVYSLSTDSWSLLEGINSLPVVPTQGFPFRNHGIYLNGSSYFLMGTQFLLGRTDFMLLSFDFTKEIFTTMQLPGIDSRHYNLVLSYLGEKLAVFTVGINCDGGDEYYDIWVLNEQHGSDDDDGDGVNNESWTKLHSFGMKSRGAPYTQPKCILNNGEFVLVSTRTDDGYWRNKLQLFNLVTKEAEKDFLIGTKVCRADVYKESLVSIMGGGNHVLLRWQLPTHGACCYKLNLNAPFIDYYHPFGIGLCLTSDKGGCIGVRSIGFGRCVRDAEQGEAVAIIEAIKWAKSLEVSPIIIETDYKSSRALSLLKAAKHLLNSSSSELGRSISFQYCSRSCNYVADIAAKHGREREGFCMDWTAEFPGEMVRSLSKDFGHSVVFQK